MSISYTKKRGGNGSVWSIGHNVGNAKKLRQRIQKGLDNKDWNDWNLIQGKRTLVKKRDLKQRFQTVRKICLVRICLHDAELVI